MNKCNMTIQVSFMGKLGITYAAFKGLHPFMNRFNMNIQVMAELRDIHRTLKRPRSDFPASSFASETSERDNFIKRAKFGYSEYLSNLGVDALKIEASRWD